VMGMALADLAPHPVVKIAEPPPGLIGTINAAAYGQPGAGYAAAFERLADPRLRRHGVIVDGDFACVAVTLEIEDDICIHYVATVAANRRQGLAAALLANVMTAARTRGVRTATLQSSPDGLGVYTALGFRRLGLLLGFVRDD
jgi:GNAT superfamily N-acetyltransferase